ncbi:MAG: hypothetical protein H0T17_04740 [Propionibacteriales bacterium]|nr:hypothetical protein [Propionibacteriales bacterium]
MQTVLGCVVVLGLILSALSELYSARTSELLRDVIKSEQAASLNLTLDTARTVMRYSLIGAGVFAAIALVLGVFVLKGDRAARIVLTVMGGLAILVTLLAGPAAWVASVYVALSLGLLWTRPARLWFSAARADQPPVSDQPMPPPPAPRR